MREYRECILLVTAILNFIVAALELVQLRLLH